MADSSQLWDEEEVDDPGPFSTDLVTSAYPLLWCCTGALAVSVVFLLLPSLFGYLVGVGTTVLCMVTGIEERRRRSNPNFVDDGKPFNLLVRLVRIAAFLACLVHIIRLAQDAAQ